MSNEISQFEARAYKRLYGLYKATTLAIIRKARATVDDSSVSSEKIEEILRAIGYEHKWEEHGIEDKITSRIINELENCLPNEQ